MGEEFLVVKNVSKSFAGVQALKKVNLTIGRAEIRCLVGENGSGKSTLIKIISGAEAPDEGEIIINGKKFFRLHPIDSIREGIQVIYQDFSLFPNLTAAENIAFNYLLEKRRRLVDWKEVHTVARKAVESINVNIPLDRKVEELSVADKQLIAISRALLHNARLIIMDEPTTALTRKEVRSLFRVIKQLQQEGVSILFVSHKLDEVLEISEKVTILRNGRNVADGDRSSFDRSKLVFYMTGREIKESRYQYKPDATREPLLRVERLGCKGSFTDVSFELYPGEILGITGLLGSGRTELAMALFGLQPATEGNIYLDGKPVRIRSVQDAIRHGMGYVPEDRLTEGLFLPQSIGNNIVVSVIYRLLKRMGIIDLVQKNQQIMRWIKDLKIVTPSPDLPVQSLSGGNQQRVVLAKWLATMPKLLILNGPTVGVDIGSKSDIHQIIRSLAQQGMGVIIISDDIPEVVQNCNRILLMKRGRIVEEFSGEQVTEEELTQKMIGEEGLETKTKKTPTFV
ncbi:MAG: simple sugar transport system ATP-binding protein [Candidatus Atribacteria bacterium]|jgi:simple sugar transport system ATP-binding protein|uniref:sugar ABC transporter ATP-binding protein n=1 Tax=Atrimonas thermophila TaxID=3064161 RepID=UPI0024AC58D7|nr:simple sugar transport system ATP-binding protein [Candidatus Atribacteria bacterium]